MKPKNIRFNYRQVGVTAVGMRSGAGCIGYGGVRLPFAKYMLKSLIPKIVHMT